MAIVFRSLTLDSIEQSDGIQDWLTQFATSQRPAAISLLGHLQFIGRDDYAAWLLAKLENYANGKPHAVFAVRKFAKTTRALWRPDGSTLPRPATTQGSEDLVASVIANALKQYVGSFYDHPSLTVLRKHRIHDIILIDDSIGSGERIDGFVSLMTNHATFRSWLSYGLITLHVLSLARTQQSEAHILRGLSGSDHGRRKRRKSDKIRFDSDIVYNAFDLHRRWGNSCQVVLDLCDSTRSIAKNRRRGFGDVMGNVVFFHSVPNNIPGMLHSSAKGWRPLFPDRALPVWCCQLLVDPQNSQGASTAAAPYRHELPEDLLALLLGIRRGIRTKAGLARRIDCDVGIAGQMLARCIHAGLVSSNLRLTKAGHDTLKRKEKKGRGVRLPDRSLYVPSSWCAG